MEALVSVIIPVYNVAPYLREALDSVIGQTYKKLQILIIDDGSTDGSGLICDEYKNDTRVTVIHQINLGLSSARNTGLELARGDYVCFLDADDAFHPEFIEILVQNMTAGNSDISVCKYSIEYSEGRITETSRRQFALPSLEQGTYGKAEALRALVNRRLNTSVWNKLYRKALWDQIRFPDGHNYEDLDTFYRVLDVSSSIYVSDIILYYYRRRSGSITQTATMQNVNDWNRACSHLDQYIEEHTPELFSEEQLKLAHRARLKWMIVLYVRSMGHETVSETLKKQICATVRETGMTGCQIRTKAAYYMVCCCPGLLKLSYSIYLPLWRFFRKTDRPYTTRRGEK